MGNCLDCCRCLVCNDADNEMAALCLLSTEKGQLCKELNYIMPLGYDSLYADFPCAEAPWITVATLFQDLREKCNIPTWCPLAGQVETGGHQSASNEETVLSLMQKIRN